MEADDERFMALALQEATKAMDEGEVPVGSVVVFKGVVIAKAHNRIEGATDATAHAEILSIGSAAFYLKDWRLENCVMYVTLEPCPMCAGAILNSRIARLVYGARDPRLGACGSACDLLSQGLLNRKTEITGGVRKEECSQLLKVFFNSLRKKNG